MAYKRGLTFVLSAALIASLVLVSPAAADYNDEHMRQARQHGRMIKRIHIPGIPDQPNNPSSPSNPESDPQPEPQPGPNDPNNSTTPTTTPGTTTAAQTSSSIDFWGTLSSLINDPAPTSTGLSTAAVPTNAPNATLSTPLTNATSTLSFLNTTTTTTSSTSSIPTTTSSDTPFIPATSTVFFSASQTPAPSPSIPASPSSDATTSGIAIARKTIVVLVALAGSIGLVFLIWTGIRKWKFRPSQEFEDRLENINWEPTGGVGHDDSDPAARLAAANAAASHKRNGSTGSHGSFGSNEIGSSQQHQGNYGYGSMSQNGGPVSIGRNRSLNGNGAPPAPYSDLQPIPAHDFTAGPTNQYGYPDNEYGPGGASPPQMVQNGLTRGGSLNGAHQAQGRPLSMRSDNPYDGMDDEDAYGGGYNHTQMPPHHGGAGY